jgi:hypothetical protein
MTIIRTLAVACALALPATAAAQQHEPLQPQRFGPSVEATFGLSAGGGGTFIERGGIAVDALVAVPVTQIRSGTMMLGVAATANGSPTSELVCVIGPDDACVPEYPVFLSAGVLGGVQRALGTTASTRALVGPAYFHAVDGEDTFGVQGRIDVAKHQIFHTAVVASVRGAVLPSYRGETLRFISFGLGFRIQ